MTEVALLYVLELAFGPEPERLAARPAHRELLHSLHKEGKLVMAGPFADESGALLVFDVPDAAALDSLVAADPYFGTPGVTVVSRREWTPIVR